MKRHQVRLSIIVIWVSLLVGGLFDYEFFNTVVGNSCQDYADNEALFGLNCRINYVISYLANIVFWGTLATVLIVSVAKIDNDEEE